MSNMVVRTNIYSLNAHRNMKNVGLQQKQASNKLASGYRINSAADDAAGLAISETMRAQIRGLDQASRNTQDGQAMLLTTEGGLDEIGNMLQRTRELLVQASNDTNTQAQRDMIRQEIKQLGTEITSMQNRVEFNTNRVLAMGPNNITDTSIASQVTAVEAAAKALVSNMEAEAKALAEYESASDADKATKKTAWTTAQTTTQTSRTAYSTAWAAMMTAGTAAIKAAADVDITTSAGNYIAYFQAGANAGQGIRFDFETIKTAVDKAAYMVSTIGQMVGTKDSGSISGIGFGQDITQLVGYVQTALDDVNKVRANLGAVQNRMDYTMRSLDISSENLSDSESRVRNADMAKEMMRFTMSNVLQQASVSMLSQANQLPQNLLQLLR